MKFTLFIFISLIFVLASCKSDTPKTEDNQEIARLKNQIRQLEMENSEKDDLINESLSLFNEIQENIARIQNKEIEIRLMSEGGKRNGNQREWMLQELQNIQFLKRRKCKKDQSIKRTNSR